MSQTMVSRGNAPRGLDYGEEIREGEITPLTTPVPTTEPLPDTAPAPDPTPTREPVPA